MVSDKITYEDYLNAVAILEAANQNPPTTVYEFIVAFTPPWLENLSLFPEEVAK